MRITGTLKIDTHGQGVYEANVDDEYDSIQDAVTALTSELDQMLAEGE